METGFHWVDFAVIAAYLAGLSAIGLYFSGRQASLKDFLLAGQGMGWLPVGLSMMAVGVFLSVGR